MVLLLPLHQFEESKLTTQEEVNESLTRVLQATAESLNNSQQATAAMAQTIEVLVALVEGLYGALGQSNPQLLRSIREHFKRMQENQYLDDDQRRLATRCLGAIGRGDD